MDTEVATVSLATTSSRSISYNELLSIYGRVPSQNEITTLRSIVNIFNEMVSIASKLEYKIHFRLLEGTCQDLLSFSPPDFIHGYKALCGRIFAAEEIVSLQRLDQLWDTFASISKDLFLPLKMEVTFIKESRYNYQDPAITFNGRLTLRL